MTDVDRAEEALDRAFAALADPVRRALVARLSRGPATVNELAEPFPISKQAVSRHIQVLEAAGLVSRTRDAQRRPVHLEAARLEAMTAWIDGYRLALERRYRVLDDLLSADDGRRRSSTQQHEHHPTSGRPAGRPRKEQS
jgi:DNA-binding transcriptional ArsR family regulator